MSTAIVYISKNGTTESTVNKIKNVAGSSIQYFDLRKETDIDISKYNNIFIGCGIYAGTVSKPMRAFLQKKELENKNIEFFIHGLDSVDTHRFIIKNSVRNNAWIGNCKMYYLGGDCDFNKQNFLVRQVLKIIAKKKNLDVKNMENLRQDVIKPFIEKFRNE